MSNGQEEIARLEAATGAFEQIITTEADSVEVPNVGTTPSLKKRVDDRFNEQYSGQVAYMQSSPSDVDEYGYPLRTLYKNGDGMIVYYPEYSVFRKDGGGWKRIDPHLRNVANFNGTTQYAPAELLTEIDFDAEDFALEVEWNGYLRGARTILYMGDDDGDSSWTKGLLCIYRYLGNMFLAIGGKGTSVSIGDETSYLDKGIWSVSVGSGVAKVRFNGETIATKAITVGESRITENTVFEIGRGRSSSGNVSTYYQGELSDLRIWTGGDRNTGVLTRDYRMGEGWRGENNQILVNYATELGEELVVNGTFDSDLSGWNSSYSDELSDVTWEGGSAHFIYNTGSNTTMAFRPDSGILTIGTNYLWKSSFDVVSEGVVWGQDVVGTQMNKNISESGDYVFTAEAVLSQSFQYKRKTGGSDVLIDNVSVRQADGYGTYVGFTEASWTQETV